MQRETVLFSGRVQGVGFRYTVNSLAQQFTVTGYVRNLDDGRVELVIEGPDSERDRLVQAVRERMQDYIRHVDRLSNQATNEFDGFSIRH